MVDFDRDESRVDQLWYDPRLTGFAKSGPTSANLGRFRPKFARGQIWSHFNHIFPAVDQTWASWTMSTEFRPGSTNFARSSAETGPDFDALKQDSLAVFRGPTGHRGRSNDRRIAQMRTTLPSVLSCVTGPMRRLGTWVEICRHRARSSRRRPDSFHSGPTSGGPGESSDSYGRSRPRRRRSQAKLARIWRVNSTPRLIARNLSNLSAVIVVPIFPPSHMPLACCRVLLTCRSCACGP